MQNDVTFAYKGWFGPTSDFMHPIWTLRLCPCAALLALILGETVFPVGFVHGLCLGLALGMLICVIGLAFRIASLTLRRPLERSDIDDLAITR